jgi:tRNA (guanosine-2'-O-)-methyltransferase
MTPERKRKISDLKAKRLSTLAMVIERVDDPHNLGAILRTCDAVGAGEVRLVYPDRPPRMRELKTRAAASAAKWLKIKKDKSAAGCIRSLRRRGFKIYAAALAALGRPQWSYDLRQKTALVVGNEHDGVSSVFLKQADGIITIPMRGMVQSLNVSVAAAVMLEEALRQRLTSAPPACSPSKSRAGGRPRILRRR